MHVVIGIQASTTIHAALKITLEAQASYMEKHYTCMQNNTETAGYTMSEIYENMHYIINYRV